MKLTLITFPFVLFSGYSNAFPLATAHPDQRMTSSLSPQSLGSSEGNKCVTDCFNDHARRISKECLDFSSLEDKVQCGIDGASDLAQCLKGCI
jgi:hypothetical protein